MRSFIQLYTFLTFLMLVIFTPVDSSSAYASNKIYLAIKMDDILIQENRNVIRYYKEMDDKDYFSAMFSVRYFSEAAFEVIERIANFEENRVKLVIYSSQNKRGMKKVLEQLAQSKGEVDDFFFRDSIILLEKKSSPQEIGPKDFDDFSKQDLIITADNEGSNSNISLGPVRFFFKDFKDIEEAKKNTKKKYIKDYFPKDQDDFNFNKYKMYYLYSLFFELINADDNGEQLLEEAKNETREFHVNLGRERLLNPKWQRYHYQWEVSGEIIIGCKEVDNKYKTTKKIEIKKCYEEFEIYQSWIIDYNNKEIIGCADYDVQDKRLIDKSQFLKSSPGFKTCLKKMNTSIFYYLSNDQTKVEKCALGSSVEGFRIIDVEMDQCLNHHSFGLKPVVNDQSEINSCQVVPVSGIAPFYQNNTNIVISSISKSKCHKLMSDREQVAYAWEIKDNKIIGCHETSTVDGAKFQSKISHDLCLNSLPHADRWKTYSDTTQIIGCEKYDTTTGATIFTYNDNTQCLKGKNFRYSWKLSSDNKKVESCQYKDVTSPYYISMPNYDKCREELKTQFFWFWDRSTNIVESCREVTAVEESEVKVMSDFSSCRETRGTHFEWDVTASLKCHEKADFKDLIVAQDIDLKNCLKNLPNTYDVKWKVNESKNAVGCSLVHKTSNKDIYNNLDIDTCIDKVNTTKKLWAPTDSFVAKKCYVYAAEGDVYIKEVGLDGCLGDTHHEKVAIYRRMTNSNSVNGCFLGEKKSKVIIEDEKRDIQECIANENVLSAWVGDKGQTQCSRYTQDGFYVEDLDAKNCSSKHAINRIGRLGVDFVDLFLDSGGNLNRYITDILSLEDGEGIPSDVYKNYDDIIISKSLIKRHNQTRDKMDFGVGKYVYDFYKITEIQVSFKDSITPLIASGCFKNQHQVGSTNGANNPSLRASLEDRMIGVDIDYYHSDREKENWVRPIYGYLTFNTDYNVKGHRFFDQYGNIIAQLKDEVKDRATFTPGDSLNINESYMYTKENTVLRTLLYKSDQPIPFYSKDIKANYFEAQVWGKVCFSDVEFFLVNCPGLNFLSEQAISNLKKYSNEVYQCEVRGPGNSFKKGKKL